MLQFLKFDQEMKIKKIDGFFATYVNMQIIYGSTSNCFGII